MEKWSSNCTKAVLHDILSLFKVKTWNTKGLAISLPSFSFRMSLGLQSIIAVRQFQPGRQISTDNWLRTYIGLSKDCKDTNIYLEKFLNLILHFTKHPNFAYFMEWWGSCWRWETDAWAISKTKYVPECPPKCSFSRWALFSFFLRQSLFCCHISPEEVQICLCFLVFGSLSWIFNSSRKELLSSTSQPLNLERVQNHQFHEIIDAIMTLPSL